MNELLLTILTFLLCSTSIILIYLAIVNVISLMVKLTGIIVDFFIEKKVNLKEFDFNKDKCIKEIKSSKFTEISDEAKELLNIKSEKVYPTWQIEYNNELYYKPHGKYASMPSHGKNKVKKNAKTSNKRYKYVR